MRFISVGGGEAVAKLLSWLSLASLPLLITPSDYGTISIVYSIIMLIFPLILAGQDRSVLSADIVGLNEELFLSLLTCLFVLFIVLIVFIVLIFSSIDFIYFLIPFVSFSLVVNKLLLCVYRVNSNFKLYSLNRIKYSFSRFVFILATVKFGGIPAYLFSEMLSSIILSVELRKIIKYRVFSWGLIKNRFFLGIPLAIHGVAGTALIFSDRYILNLYYSSVEVGNYSYAYTVASSIVFVFSILAIIYEPSIYQAKNNDEVKKISNIFLTKMFLVGVPIAFILIATYYFSFIFIMNYEKYDSVFFVLLLAHMLMPIYIVSNYILIRFKKSNKLLRCTLIAILVNVILNFIAIPQYGVNAAAITTLIANFILAVLTSREARLQFKEVLINNA